MAQFIKNQWPVLLIVAVTAMVVALFAVGYEKNLKVFKETCSKSGGTTVYDGRQHQCIKP